MKKYFEVLKKCHLFNEIAENELEKVLSCLGALVVYKNKGEAVFTEGDPAKYLGIVLNGSVQIVRDDYYGNHSILAMIDPSELFAEAFACSDTKTIPVNIIAVCNSEVMLIDCKKILQMCSNTCEFHSKLVENLLRIVANKNIILNQKIEITSKRTTKEKLMTYLLAQAKNCTNKEFTIPYNRQSLADYLEVERSAMSAEISKLKNEGVIDTKKNWFKIL